MKIKSKIDENNKYYKLGILSGNLEKAKELYNHIFKTLQEFEYQRIKCAISVSHIERNDFKPIVEIDNEFVINYLKEQLTKVSEIIKEKEKEIKIYKEILDINVEN